MKFKIDQMLTEVEAAIERQTAVVAKEEEARTQRYAEEVDRWRSEFADQWGPALTKMRTKLRKGQAIDRADLPTDPRRGGVAVVERERYRTRATEKLRALEGIRKMLQAADGATVSHTELERASGYRFGEVFHNLLVDLDDED